jgi:hypothetical protein
METENPDITTNKTQKSKEYNKQYYAKNKDEILRKLNSKVQCEFCDRTVIKNNFHKHQKSDICKRKQEEKINRLKRLNLANE